MLALGFASGLPLLWGAPPPRTAQQLLSPVLVHLWGYTLVLGCLLALLGVCWTWWGWLGKLWPRFQPADGTGLLIEQLGVLAVGVGTVIYGAGILVADQPGSYLAAGIILGFGAACFWRFGQIQRLVKVASTIEPLS